VKYYPAVILIVLMTGCKHNPVDAPKDPREYTWTMEIIGFPGGGDELSGMYATGSKNIWIALRSYTGPDRLFCYDGTTWNSMSSPYGTGSPHHITGFGRNDMWIVGDRWDNGNNRIGFIAHYDGFTWTDVKHDGMNMLETVWGSGPSDVWFGGFYGTLMHYDGISFKPDSVPMSIPTDPRYYWAFSTGASLSREISYALLVGQDQSFSTKSYTFKRDGSKWTFLDSTVGIVPSLWYGPWGKLYRTGQGISYLDGSSWKTMNLDGGTRGVCGNAEDNLIATGPSYYRNAGVYHWNGTDWYEFKDLPGPDFRATEVWTDSREVFVAGNGDAGICILHGK